VPEGFVEVREPGGAGRAPLVGYFRAPAAPGRATVVVVHGLYDSKHSRYVRLSAEALAAGGFGVLVPDMRWHGCLLADSLPALGVEEGRDLAAWSGWLRAQRPESPVGLLGYSLGSLAVVHALAADGGAFRAGGIAVSPPAALGLTLAGLDDRPSFARHGREALIRAFFRYALRVRLRTLGIEEGPERRPFAAFLEWLVHQSAFPPGTTPEQAIASAGPRPQLAAVRRPLLLVISRRDPVFSPAAVPELEQAAAANPFLHLVATTDGGHIGHPGTYPRWTAEVYHRFFAASPDVPPGEP
jgi:predicted alpha/beta-fold hydrolase